VGSMAFANVQAAENPFLRHATTTGGLHAGCHAGGQLWWRQNIRGRQLWR
jgi:hypothetical protein